MNRLESRRYFHERTGEPLSAYVVGEYVIEKARRDWDARPYRGSAGNPDKREWWEVRRQGSLTQPGVSIGPVLFEGDTLRECRRWCEGQSNRDPEIGTCQSCGGYWDAMLYKACPSCGGYLG